MTSVRNRAILAAQKAMRAEVERQKPGVVYHLIEKGEPDLATVAFEAVLAVLLEPSLSMEYLGSEASAVFGGDGVTFTEARSIYTAMLTQAKDG